jgi:hypothetical protein
MANGVRLYDAITHGLSCYPDVRGAKKFCINNYVLYSDLIGIDPDYYLLLDPSFFIDEASLNEDLIAKAALDGHCTIEDAETELRRALEVKTKISNNPNIKLFVPYTRLNLFAKNSNVYGILGATNTAANNIVDITKTLGWRSMSAYVAISIATYLGHNPIYIAGFDNDSWKSISWDREKNETLYNFKHFYPEVSFFERRTDMCVHEMLSSASSINRLQSKLKVINLDPAGLF